MLLKYFYNQKLAHASYMVGCQKTGEAVKAYIVSTNPDLTAEQVLAHCRDSLTNYKRPKQIEFVDDIPKTDVLLTMMDGRINYAEPVNLVATVLDLLVRGRACVGLQRQADRGHGGVRRRRPFAQGRQNRVMEQVEPPEIPPAFLHRRVQEPKGL